MTSNARYAPTVEDTVIPWNATYEFPTAANKALKITPRITPLSGQGAVLPQQTIQFNFPAQGYVNGKNSTIVFDVYLKGFDSGYTGSGTAGGTNGSRCYFQNNIESIFKRVEVKYGSYVVEKNDENGYLQRQLCEHLTYSTQDTDQNLINRGIGGVVNQYVRNANAGIVVPVNQRMMTHGLLQMDTTDTASTERTRIAPAWVVINGVDYAVKRYQIPIPSGLFNNGKLLPVKYMASQLSINLTLAKAEEVIMATNKVAITGNAVLQPGTPSFYLQNVAIIPEILEFDSTYDAMFLKSLEMGGVPIQFPVWKQYTFPVLSSTLNFAIPEKSRFVKSIFCFVRKIQTSFLEDAGASIGDFQDAKLQSFQCRIGGRYFPASPVQIESIPGLGFSSGVEALTELQKALHTLNDGSLSNACSPERWNAPLLSATGIPVGYTPFATLSDGQVTLSRGTLLGGQPSLDGFVYQTVTSGGILSSLFCMAVSLETSNGRELSGLNAEEQSDINFQIKYSQAPPAGFEVVCYTLCDKVMVIKENNNVDIIE